MLAHLVVFAESSELCRIAFGVAHCVLDLLVSCNPCTSIAVMLYNPRFQESTGVLRYNFLNMRNWQTLLFCFCVAMAAPAHSQDVASQESCSLHHLFLDDQLARKQFQKRSAWTSEKLKELASADASRIWQVKELVKAGRLKRTRDLYEAAMILQHGKDPEDFLLAHILASAAAFRGHKQARWLSAATLDRYLHDVGKAQVFGTQFRTKNADGEHSIWSMDLLNQELLSDELRELYGVPPLSSGVARLSELNGGKQLGKPIISRSVSAIEKEHRQ